ncbi:PRD domain-containing protein [Cryobacterium sp. TMT2-17-1]|uniref:PRD domain-containing protein n=1 Tax=unclassified Cryobacterium TaxID=2649013 RepID=UPI00106D49C2|nr:MULTISPECIES: PRD domain-containing protein [unclassified Cryobacterium]TFB54264.1 PRD domain-containing protein [Cryobacterium sp. Sr3]TFB60675.1 PRD domain-containing protein [Cryobacterium sp. Hz7]TFC49017.1 PRD domain-containing protein [Cryobacterium sp. TMT2-17-1]
MEVKPSTQASIKRVYNNNVVLAIESDTMEVVLLGKGIGFQRRPGETIDTSLANQRFVADGAYRAAQVAGLLSEAPLDQIALAQTITELGHATLGLEPRQSLMIPVLDHLTFAVRRAIEGIRIDFPLRWEVAQLYPSEAALGRQVVTLVSERLGVRLQDDEWVAFALHFVNQQWTKGDFSRTVVMTETIGRVFLRLAERWGQPIDENASSAARFVTHLRYVFARAAADEQLHSSHQDLLAAVRQLYPEAVEAAIDIAQLIGDAIHRVVSIDEISYLALHTGRLYAEMKEP